MSANNESKYVFLDVDGVLNTLDWTRAFMAPPYDEDLLVEDLIKKFCDFVKEDGISVVLSSTWRLTPEHFRKIQSRLGKHGVEIIGSTGITNTGRGFEILEYAATHNIERYAVLDDMPHMRPITKRFVKTDPTVGITDGNIKQCREILSQPQE